jgi:uncharacterized protein (DUF2126 family)
MHGRLKYPSTALHRLVAVCGPESLKVVDIHVKRCNTEMCRKSVINMGTKIYNKLPGSIKEIEKYNTFKRELKKFLLLHSFYYIEEF